jgi:hypothetical protein
MPPGLPHSLVIAVGSRPKTSRQYVGRDRKPLKYDHGRFSTAVSDPTTNPRIAALQGQIHDLEIELEEERERT